MREVPRSCLDSAQSFRAKAIESRSGWATKRMCNGIANESPHWRTGIRGHDVIDQVGGDFCHAPGAAPGTIPSAFAGENDQFLMDAVATAVSVIHQLTSKMQRVSVGILYTSPFWTRASFSKCLDYNDRPLIACFMLMLVWVIRLRTWAVFGFVHHGTECA